MRQKVLVTGAAGKTAHHVAELLRRDQMEVRALVRRDDERARRLAEAGAEIVVGDMMSFADMTRAVGGVDSVYFCYPTSDRVLEATATFTAAAIAAGVRHVVNMSQIIARPDAPSPTSRSHWLAERHLDLAPFAVTHLRPTFFADQFVLNVKHTIAKQGRIIRPYGTASHAPIASFDIARGAAAILREPLPHVGKTYVITGVDRLSFPGIAAIFSDLLGRRIDYVDVPLDDFEKDMRERGFAESLLTHHLESSRDYKNGAFDVTNDLVEQITGRPPQRFKDYIADHLDLFRAAA